jgi:hypothetical protein
VMPKLSALLFQPCLECIVNTDLNTLLVFSPGTPCYTIGRFFW